MGSDSIQDTHNGRCHSFVKQNQVEKHRPGSHDQSPQTISQTVFGDASSCTHDNGLWVIVGHMVASARSLELCVAMDRSIPVFPTLGVPPFRIFERVVIWPPDFGYSAHRKMALQRSQAQNSQSSIAVWLPVMLGRGDNPS
jgi:hypothetical protein